MEFSVFNSIDTQFTLHAIPGEFLILDTDLRIRNASQDFLRATQTNLKKGMQQVIETKEPYRIANLRYDLAGPNGKRKPHYWDIVDTPILNNQNEVIGLIHHTTNVTRQVLEREEARRKDEMIRVVTQTMNDVVWDWNLETNELRWSEGFASKFGYEEYQTDSKIDSWLSYIHPDDAPLVTDSIHTFIENGKGLWNYVYRFRLKNGSYADILDRGVVFRDQDGKACRMVGAMVDITLNKTVEKAALKSEARFKSVLDSLPNMAWAASPDGTIYYYNQQWPNLLGISLNHLYDKGWEGYMHPDDLHRTLRNWELCLKTGENVEIEHRFLLSPDNAYKWFLTRAMPVRNTTGEIIDWIGTCTNIDDQKKYSQQLKEQEEKIQLILSQAPAHFCLVKGKEQVIDFASPGIIQLFGNRPCLNLPIAEAWPEIAEQGLTNNMRQVFDSGKPQHFWERMVLVDRENSGELTEGYYDFTYQPFRNSNGDITGILVLAVEVTEQVLAKQAAFKLSEQLLEEKERFDFLADTIPQLVWTTDPIGYHTYFNQRWIEYTGYDLVSSQGTEMWNNLLHPEDRERSRLRWQHSLDTGEFYEIEYRFKSKEGGYRWFLGQAAPMRNAEGEIYKWFGTCTDIEEQKRWQESLIRTNDELEKANADLDSFVYTASHDLKLPIISMSRIFNELNKSATYTAPDAGKLVGMFQNSLTQINNTIQDLADIVKVQKNAELSQETLIFEAVLEEVKLSIQDMISDSEANLISDFCQAPEIYFSHVNLKSILYNLVSNAIKYRSPDRTPVVRIKTWNENGWAVLTVQDNGLGINLERHRDKMFQMFKRFHNHLPGSGIGLYIVNRIVENQGGSIELQSEVGQGTIFKVMLPIKNHKNK